MIDDKIYKLYILHLLRFDIMKLPREFYSQSALTVAPSLIGKLLCRKLEDGQILKKRITETEAYCGEEDSACHAHKGKTARTKVMYQKGGCAYIYFVYGMHYLLNVVTGKENEPEAVLIRAVEGFNGPAKLTKAMQIDKSFNGIDLTENTLWIEDDGCKANIKTTKRIGIDYACEKYKNIEWRWEIAINNEQ